MKRAGLALLLGACSAGHGNGLPTRPDGGTAGDGGAGDGGVLVAGRVCLVQDLRAPTTTCETTKAGGLKVTLGTAGTPGAAAATTGADGSFVIVARLGAGFTWHVTGANLVTSVMPSVMTFGTDNTIPAMLGEQYLQLRESNTLHAIDEQHGSVVVRAVRGVAPAANVIATLSPLADSETRYDSRNSASDWNTTATQDGGIVWVPDVQLPGPVTVTLGQMAGTTVKTTVSVERQAITFVTQAVP